MPLRRCASTFLALAAISIGVAACSAGTSSSPAAAAGSLRFATTELTLPGSSGIVLLDYIAFDRASGALWVPASSTGSVDVIDGATDRITQISGFGTSTFEMRGRAVVLGPTSVTIGDGVAYVGNRADSSVCAVDTSSLALGRCRRIGTAEEGLAAAPDAVVYVRLTRELWVTRGAPPMGITPPDHSILILDVAGQHQLDEKARLELSGSAKGYAVDESRGLFFTSIEEERRTVAIDVHTRQIVKSWQAGCSEPHGLAIDEARGILLVACPERVVSLDVEHEGQVLGSIDTGAGVDNIAYLPATRMVYAAAADAAALTIARLGDRGQLERVATVPTTRSARGVVVDDVGRAYLINPLRGSIWKLTPDDRP